ncbi:hypothetical protein H4582DRAFT_1974568 [Lactarius indigo]|nr:hypothetical protein H4582DRAFT_1974568 [Lactarius indigo]
MRLLFGSLGMRACVSVFLLDRGPLTSETLDHPQSFCFLQSANANVSIIRRWASDEKPSMQVVCSGAALPASPSESL